MSYPMFTLWHIYDYELDRACLHSVHPTLEAALDEVRTLLAQRGNVITCMDIERWDGPTTRVGVWSGFKDELPAPAEGA